MDFTFLFQPVVNRQLFGFAEFIEGARLAFS
jgi:hypothetical protein